MLNNQFLRYILIIMSVTIEIWGCKKVFDYTSDKKSSNLKINSAMAIIIIFIFELLKNDLSKINVIIISIILTFVLYIWNYDTKISIAIITTLIYWMVLTSINSLDMSILIWINSLDNMRILLMSNVYRLQLIVLDKAILIILVYIYKKTKFKIKLQNKEILYLIIPIVSNVVIYLLVVKDILYFSTMGLISNTHILYISILLFCSTISIILAIRKISCDSSVLTQKNIMIKNIDMQYSYYKNIKESQENLRHLYHDIKNHLICIKRLNEHGYDNEKYIKNIENKLSIYDNIFDTGNILLDIILNEKNQICKEENITLSGYINFTKCDFIEVEDICSIFANILDNSIEACRKVKESNRFISLEGKIVEKFFILKVKNSKANKVNIRNNKFVTDKKDSFSHGIGISSVKKTVEKYNGETVIDYTDNEFTIKLLIPIGLYND